MNLKAHILFLALTFASSMAVFAGAHPDESKSIQGTWVPTSAELGAVGLPPQTLKMITLKLADGKYEVQAEALDKGTYKIDTTAKIHTMDIVGTEGPNAGKTILAIYEMTGGTLRICYSLGKGPRPTEFKSPGESSIFLATYKRVAPAPVPAAGN